MSENEDLHTLKVQVDELCNLPPEEFDASRAYQILAKMEANSSEDNLLLILKCYEDVRRKANEATTIRIYLTVRSIVEKTWKEAYAATSQGITEYYILELFTKAYNIAKNAVAEYPENTQLKNLTERARNLREFYAFQENVMTSGVASGHYLMVLDNIEQYPDELHITVLDDFGGYRGRMPKAEAKKIIIGQARRYVDERVAQYIYTSHQLLNSGHPRAALEELKRYKQFKELAKYIDNPISTEQQARIYRLEQSIYSEIPDAFQEPTPRYNTHSAPKLHIFISYSHYDTDFMQRIIQYLSNEQLETWVDTTGIEIGSPSWRKTIESAIEECSCVVVLLSPYAKNSEWVAAELEYSRIHQKKVFAILIAGDEKVSVPFGYASLQWVDVRDNSEYQARMEDLATAISKYVNTVAG